MDAGQVIYADGVLEAADEIILATGYRASLLYLPAETFDYRDGTQPHLWTRLFHPTRPGPNGLGFIETNSSVYRLFDLGAELIAGHVRSRLDGTSAFTDLDVSLASGAEPTSKERPSASIRHAMSGTLIAGSTRRRFGASLKRKTTRVPEYEH